ncbi:FHA domain-containing protein DDL isoform X3 [Cucumis melo]|uniref:FHA domain-containing protein DDL isoform X3 n=1 Tax=Cucumis melo TaxID=3656 RepID=A0ABM3KMI5_CUCME|nr:FHA domain-containing protein DDL isoform X3 [Cucumis melo]
MGRNVSDDPESPGRVRRSSPRRSPSRRGRSPTRHKSSHNGSSPARDKHSSRAKSPKHGRSSSPRTRSPSPRTKRLRRAAEKVPDKSSDRDHERNRGRGSDKEAHRERVSDRELGGERKERSSRQDVKDGKSSRSRHGNSSSPSERHQRNRHRSPSPQPDAKNHDEVSVVFALKFIWSTTSNCHLTFQGRNSRRPESRSDDDDSVAKMKAAEQALEAKQKDKPSFELSGKLAAETNRVRGITLLFNEPPDARKPDVRWRLYVFKAGEVLNEPLYIHRQSCYLFGRERRVADIPTDHPSCSKQHAVIQFRQVEKEQSDGTLSKQALFDGSRKHK